MRVSLGGLADLAVLMACTVATVIGAARLKEVIHPTALRSRASRSAIELLKVDVPISDLPSEGNPSARIAVVEFSDFQCPFCGKYARDTYESVKREFVDTGKVQYAFVNYPLAIHPLASKASQAALCAADQGRFWQMHDRLFANQSELTDADLDTAAGHIGLGITRFHSCLTNDAGRLDQGKAIGAHVGVTGTPAFLIGQIQGGSVHGTVLIHGAQEIETFRNVIGAALRGNQSPGKRSN